MFLVLALSGRPAGADTPLSTPGTPVAGAVTTTSVSFSWTPSTGPVANYTVEVTPIFASLPERLFTATTPNYTRTPVSWNTRILPGAGTSVGFNATRSGDAPRPSGFAIMSPDLRPILCTG